MNKLKTFFYSFIKSISNPAYYKDVVKAPIGFSFKYVLFLSYILLLFYTVVIVGYMATMLPQLPQFIISTKTQLDQFYPKDLVVQIKNGIVSINQENPVFLDIPELQNEEFEHIIVINTQAQVEDFIDYKTFFLVTDDSVVYPDSPSGYTVTSVGELVDNTNIERIDRNIYEQFLSVAFRFLDSIPTYAPWTLIGIVIIFPFIIALFEFSRNIITVAFLSLVTWLVASLLKTKLSYINVFQMGLHAVTVPLLFMIILFFTGVSIPLLFAASFLLWMVIILTQYKES
ncbi:MAG TPA: DUF1189 family protein [Candidatus Woesebacteria bacterium]|nr:DUF1189 family protein [Candidatus Woesebacteria bacterium]